MLQKRHFFYLTLLAITLLTTFALISLRINPAKQSVSVPTLAQLPSVTASFADERSRSAVALPTTAIAEPNVQAPSSTPTNPLSVLPTATPTQPLSPTAAVTTAAPRNDIPTSLPEGRERRTQAPAQMSFTPSELIPLSQPPDPVSNTQIITLADNIRESQRQALIEQVEIEGGEIVQTIDALNTRAIGATVTPAPTPTPTQTISLSPVPSLLTSIISDPRALPLVPGNATLDPEAEQMLRAVLVRERGRSIEPSNYYSISALRQEGDWYFVSIVGLMLLDPDIGWRLEDANWFGLVLLHRGDGGNWQGAVEGTALFTELVEAVPTTTLSMEAKLEIDPLRLDAQATEIYRFPWQSGTRMVYGSLGVHDNGFSSVVPGWKAVDFLSNGDTGAGYAPNRLLAAAAGTIGYVCDDGVSVAIRIGNLFYTHLLDNSLLYTGSTFNQGDELGQMKSGTFNYRCGYVSQGASWFHVHWGFPNNATFTVEDWTLNLSDSIWRKGSETRGPNSQLQAGSNNAPCPAPTLNSPADNASLSSATVSFAWMALNTCTFNGYIVRVNDSANMDDTPIIDASVTNTTYSATVAAQWHNRDLWWGVRAANAPTGAEWAIRRFRINISDTTAPTGSMIAPTDGSYQRGPMIWLQANASDSGSGVNRVEFYAWSAESWSNQQWILLNVDTTAPYEYSWNITSVPDGNVWLSANIIDNAGNQSGIIWGTFVTIDRSLEAASGIGIYYNNTWYLRNNPSSGSPDYMPTYGGFGVPVVGDWNGNGTDTLGIYANGTWYLRNSNNNGAVDYPVFQYGGFGVPVVGDWNGDGIDTVGIYANGAWHLRNSNSSGGVDYPIFQYGGFGVPVVGDWNGDGRDTIGIYNPADGRWYLRNSNSSGGVDYPIFQYGGFGTPVVGTWNIAGVFSYDGAMTAFSGDWYAIMEANREQPTLTSTPTRSATPSATPTPSVSASATVTPTPTITQTATSTATAILTLTSTATQTGAPTEPPTTTPVPTEEPTLTATLIPATATFSSPPTITASIPTATASPPASVTPAPATEAATGAPMPESTQDL